MTNKNAEWRIVESLAFRRGNFGIETIDEEAAKVGDEVIVPPCLTRENAELIVKAHNGELTCSLSDLESARQSGSDLAAAAEQLLATTPAERNDPATWRPRVDAMKTAIKVMRGKIPHGHVGQ